jgi:enoyl-CoA hydratase/carnithine racemase
MPDEVLVETRGNVMVITLNRAEVVNAINTPLAGG